MNNNYFLNMIQGLRLNGEVLLYGNILNVPEADAALTVEFLQDEYEQEAGDYPYQPPAFDGDAALWAAQTIYITAQLILYRENKDQELAALLPAFKSPLTPAAIVSADLCLRFLPDMLRQLQLIDPDDALNTLLHNLLQQWHYSGVAYELPVETLDMATISGHPCLLQLYQNRIVQYKKLALALHPVFKPGIQANLGIFAAEFWNDFKNATNINDSN